MNTEVPYVCTSVIKKTLNGMSRGKAGDEDVLFIDLIKYANDFLLDKHIIRFTKSLQTCYAHKAGKKHHTNTNSQEKTRQKP